MHSLVYLATRIWIQKQGHAKQTTERAIRHLAKIFPSQDYANRTFWRAYLPHALMALQKREVNEIEERPSLCTVVGHCLLADGRTKEALKYFDAAYTVLIGLYEHIDL